MPLNTEQMKEQVNGEPTLLVVLSPVLKNIHKSLTQRVQLGRGNLQMIPCSHFEFIKGIGHE